MDKSSGEYWNWDDWNRETSLRTVSLGARGLWIEMLCIMHRASPRGALSTERGRRLTPLALARLVGSTEAEVTELLKQLEDAGIFSRLLDKTIINRRMYRKMVIAEVRSEAGKRGANNRWHGDEEQFSLHNIPAQSQAKKYQNEKNGIAKTTGVEDSKKNKTAKNVNANGMPRGINPKALKTNSSNSPIGLLLSFTPHRRIVFDFNQRGWHNISQEDFDEWADAFPACDISQELQKMKVYMLANPKKAKKDWKRFIVNWLSRQQDRGGTKGSQRSTGTGSRAQRWAEGEKKTNEKKTKI